MKRSKKVWLTIGGIVLAHNLTADDGDTLSEAVDSWLTTHPVITRAAITVLALHLANGIQARYDVVHLVFTAARRRRLIVVVETQNVG